MKIAEHQMCTFKTNLRGNWNFMQKVDHYLAVRLSCAPNDPVPYKRCKDGNGRRIRMLRDPEQQLAIGVCTTLHTLE